jgi:hypothetical protein
MHVQVFHLSSDVRCMSLYLNVLKLDQVLHLLPHFSATSLQCLLLLAPAGHPSLYPLFLDVSDVRGDAGPCGCTKRRGETDCMCTWGFGPTYCQLPCTCAAAKDGDTWPIALASVVRTDGPDLVPAQNSRTSSCGCGAAAGGGVCAGE